MKLKKIIKNITKQVLLEALAIDPLKSKELNPESLKAEAYRTYEETGDKELDIERAEKVENQETDKEQKALEAREEMKRQREEKKIKQGKQPKKETNKKPEKKLKKTKGLRAEVEAVVKSLIGK
jgi:hypothetical protein